MTYVLITHSFSVACWAGLLLCAELQCDQQLNAAEIHSAVLMRSISSLRINFW